VLLCHKRISSDAANRLSLVTHKEADRGAGKFVFFAQPILQKLEVRGGHILGMPDEEDEDRGFGGHLSNEGGLSGLGRLAPPYRERVLRENRLKQMIQRAGRNALIEGRDDLINKGKETAQAIRVQRGREEDRRPRKEREFPAQTALVRLSSFNVSFLEVPFVDQENTGAALPYDQPGNLRILLGDSLLPSNNRMPTSDRPMARRARATLWPSIPRSTFPRRRIPAVSVKI
jgi:hypothetical protein